MGKDTLNGGAGVDTAEYSESASSVIANLENSTLNTGEAAGDLYNAIENITGSRFNDAITGNAQVNILTGGEGNDTLYGRAGNDSLYGGAGDDTLFGEDGNDILVGGAGADIFDGGKGSDIVSYADATSAVIVDMVSLNLGAGDATRDSFIGIETIEGSSYNDKLYADQNDNILYGYGGNDYLDGRDGNDTLYGGIGDDSLVGGAGKNKLYGEDGNDTFFSSKGTDALNGGNGLDTVSYADSGASAHVNLGSSAKNTGAAAGDTFISIENVAGTNHNDTIYGSAKIANTLWGNEGNDTMYGLSGDDILYGGAGNDTLYGDKGKDHLYAGAGADELYGGSEADVFHFGINDNTFRKPDTIQDFNKLIDKIALHDILSIESGDVITNYITAVSSGNNTTLNINSNHGYSPIYIALSGVDSFDVSKLYQNGTITLV